MAGTGTAHLRPDADPVLTVRDLTVEFPAGRGTVHAVSGVSFDLLDGETLGILGESGCGKSSTGRAVLQAPPPSSGSVRLGGTELTGLPPARLREQRARLQMILQNPVAALNPRRRVRDLVAEGPAIRGERPSADRVDEVLRSVGLDPATVRDRRPHELSGGQCQRVCIARALMTDPDVLICDEPVSSLDVSVQAQILNLLERTRTERRLSMIFIAHDLAVVKNVSDRVLVMYLGKVCEVVPSSALATESRHPYTRLLLASVPEAPDTAAPAANTDPPSPLSPPSGCRFRTRCPLATDRCATEEPELREHAKNHHLACHHA
ncbi:oligopeptide/dipeptide ABC transporter ATP-binding protein [Actinomadura rifamycini]|uniref:oligopeptide/dipeptide ABC transporter ATP-binding protein n=1 Tax=Actinomadura rifamycini TaxID=31962 RepID=UPI00042561DD|nr:ABC transporter ATP-binding protein [Actinomadura rifamycini]